jgi:hypothetical protein
MSKRAAANVRQPETDRTMERQGDTGPQDGGALDGNPRGACVQLAIPAEERGKDGPVMRGAIETKQGRVNVAGWKRATRDRENDYLSLNVGNTRARDADAPTDAPEGSIIYVEQRYIDPIPCADLAEAAKVLLRQNVNHCPSVMVNGVEMITMKYRYIPGDCYEPCGHVGKTSEAQSALRRAEVLHRRESEINHEKWLALGRTADSSFSAGEDAETPDSGGPQTRSLSQRRPAAAARSIALAIAALAFMGFAVAVLAGQVRAADGQHGAFAARLQPKLPSVAVKRERHARIGGIERLQPIKIDKQ